MKSDTHQLMLFILGALVAQTNLIVGVLAVLNGKTCGIYALAGILGLLLMLEAVLGENK